MATYPFNACRLYKDRNLQLGHDVMTNIARYLLHAADMITQGTTSVKSVGSTDSASRMFYLSWSKLIR